MTIPYTKQGPFVNNSPPAINATRLNAMEQGIYDATLYGADAGGDDTYVLNLDTTLAEGLSLKLKVTTGNIGACTLSIDNGVTSKTIRKMTSSGLADLETGDIKAGQIVELLYDGTYWQLLTGNKVVTAENATNADNATNATNADKINNRLYNQLAYETYRDRDGIVQYESSNFYSDNIWKYLETNQYNIYGDTGKNLVVNCDEIDFIKIDLEIYWDLTTGTTSNVANVTVKFVDDTTAIEYSETAFPNIDEVTYTWKTIYLDVGELIGTHTFSLHMKITYSGFNNTQIGTRGFDAHKNKINQVGWN